MELTISSGGEAFTDAQGRFTFDAVPVGSVTLKVEDEAYAAYTSELDVTKDTELELKIYVEKVGFDDVLRVVDRRIKPEVVRRTVQVEEVRLIPGYQWRCSRHRTKPSRSSENIFGTD